MLGKPQQKIIGVLPMCVEWFLEHSQTKDIQAISEASFFMSKRLFEKSKDDQLVNDEKPPTKRRQIGREPSTSTIKLGISIGLLCEQA